MRGSDQSSSYMTERYSISHRQRYDSCSAAHHVLCDREVPYAWVWIDLISDASSIRWRVGLRRPRGTYSVGISLDL